MITHSLLQQRRLLFAFAISVLAHALLIAQDDLKQLFSAAPRLPAAVVLQARLLPPMEIAPLLKNSLSEFETRISRPSSPSSRQVATAVTPRKRDQASQRKLADHLFYPREAVSRGLQGEVRLLLTLDRQGRVIAARVASSSGHALLDRAATDAAYAIGSIPGAGNSEMILPVIFRLQ